MRRAALIAAASLTLVLCPHSAVAASGPSFCRASTAQGVKAGVVGPATAGISLALRSKTVRPGQMVYARLLNRGPKLATYGPVFRIERYVDGQWSTDPSSPHGPWLKIIGLLNPGRTGKCFKFEVPAEQPAGRFRFVTAIRSKGMSSQRFAGFVVSSGT